MSSGLLPSEWAFGAGGALGAGAGRDSAEAMLKPLPPPLLGAIVSPIAYCSPGGRVPGGIVPGSGLALNARMMLPVSGFTAARKTGFMPPSMPVRTGTVPVPRLTSAPIS